MRAHASGRRLLASISLTAALTYAVGLGGGTRAVASEDLRTCLARESGEFFTKLAMAIGSAAIDPARIDDGFIAQGSETMIEACKQSTEQSTQSDIADFRAHMAKWHALLDRRLSDFAVKGGAD